MRNAAPFLLCAIVALQFMHPRAATGADDFPSGPDRRVLGGHQFQPVTGIRDPFVTTHLHTLTGAGIASGFEAPFVSTEGDTLGTLDGDLAFFNLQFEYQLNLFDWGSVLINVAGTGRAGIDEQALLADGLTTVYGIRLEGKGVVWHDDRTQLAALVSLSRKNLFGIDPFGFAQRIVEEGGLTKDNRLVTEGDINRGSLGLAGAHGFRPWLGLSGFVSAGSAQPVVDDDDREAFVQVGAGAGFDLNPHYGIPMGFSLAYDFDSFPEGGSDVAKGIHRGTLGFNYTGREDFHFGFEIAVATLKQTDIENSLAATTGSLTLRYYF